MADLVTVPASVVQVSGSPVQGPAGVAVVAGQAVYKDAADGNKLKLADANASSATAECVGIAVASTPGVGQQLNYQASGDINLGVTLTVGKIYVLSATPGGIAPVGDLATGWFVTVLGIAISTTVLRLAINVSGVATP